MNELLNRVKGALVGSALGDTIGIYTGRFYIIPALQICLAAGLLKHHADFSLAAEFLTPEQALQVYGPVQTFSLVEPVTETVQDRHRCRFESRAWTDDTDHTIIIVRARHGQQNGLSLTRIVFPGLEDFIISAQWHVASQRLRKAAANLARANKGFDAWIGFPWAWEVWQNLLPLFCDLTLSPLRGTTGRIVFNKGYLDDPSGTAFADWEKGGCNNAPNGSVMRTSPIGVICLNETEEETFRSAIQMGAVTHAGPKCALSVAIVSALIRGLCKSEITTEADVDAVLERAWTYVALSMPEHPLERDEFDKYAFAETLGVLVLCDQYMGYVYKALGSGLWALRQTLNGRDTFESAMVKLVMCGGDADTNGTVAGALMGAHCGYQALPPAWRDGMRHREWLMEKIVALCVVAGIVEGSYDPQADPHTEFDGGNGFLDEEEMKRREMQVMERILLAEKRRRDAVEAAKKEQNKRSWKFW